MATERAPQRARRLTALAVLGLTPVVFPPLIIRTRSMVIGDRR